VLTPEFQSGRERLLFTSAMYAVSLLTSATSRRQPRHARCGHANRGPSQYASVTMPLRQATTHRSVLSHGDNADGRCWDTRWPPVTGPFEYTAFLRQGNQDQPLFSPNGTDLWTLVGVGFAVLDLRYPLRRPRAAGCDAGAPASVRGDQ